MASEESESSSSGLGERSSSPVSGHGSKIYGRRKTKEIISTEKYSRRILAGRRRGRPRADSCKPIFHAEAVDPEVDRAIVVDAVHFVLSASSKGCYSLVSKFAEHLKYKISLEEKVIFLNRELKELRKSTPISLELETSRLTKPFVRKIKEPNVAEQDITTEFVLPGAIPNAAKTSNDQKSSKTSPTTVSKFQDKAFGNDSVTDSLPTISANEISLCMKKSCADAQIQRVSTSLKKPAIMVERGSSPDSQLDSYKMLQDQLNIAQEMVTQLKYQLTLSEKAKNTAYRDIETQTDDIALRKPELVERDSCQKLERESDFKEVQQQLSNNDNKIHSPESGRKLESKPMKPVGGLTWLSRSRASSALSMTNASSKSFPGVKNKCGKCIQVKNEKRSGRKTPNEERPPRIGDHVITKGCKIQTDTDDK